MAKKKNQNEEVNATEEVVEEVDTVEAEPVEAEPKKEEPIKVEVPKEEPKKEEVKVEEPVHIVVENKALGSASVNQNGWYIRINDSEVDEVKLNKIEERLAKTGLNYETNALGQIMVGPFESEKEALLERKKVLGRGLKGVIVSIDED